MSERAKPKVLRCAIYTRKSSEEGLEQDFNSLHAQREACEAYIASQRHEGWKVLKTAYDDGGFSGGSMERPALKRLLADIGSGLVDVVVVYKVDRLTRALADFAKIVEIFDAQGISFVSVTQQFNTTSSMGRLTLNVLLSFAQFEREVTGERIRDKIAASKKKGLWMGGFVPLGYRPDQRTLVVHDSEAEVVRTIFALYTEYGSVAKVQAELERRGIARPESTATTTGRPYGGRAFGRGEIYKLLSNPIYLGEIGHKGQRYEGRHPAIIDRDTWMAVQARLAGNTHARHIRLNAKDPSLLAGLLYDDQGNRLTPTHANKRGKRYRYYALQPRDGRMRARGRPPESARRWRIAAAEIESAVIERLCALFDDRDWLSNRCSSPDSTIERRQAITAKGRGLAERIRSAGGGALRELLLGILAQVTLGEADVRIIVKRVGLLACLGVADEIGSRTAGGGDAQSHDHNSSSASAGADTDITITVPLKLRRRGVETKLVIGSADDNAAPRQPDPALIKLMAHAHQWWDDLMSNRFPTVRALARAYNKDERYVARTLPYAFLAPSLVEAIVCGRQPVDLTAQDLMTLPDLPIEWAQQRSVLRLES
jgi:site-specific DNA recombinase